MHLERTHKSRVFVSLVNNINKNDIARDVSKGKEVGSERSHFISFGTGMSLLGYSGAGPI